MQEGASHIPHLQTAISRLDTVDDIKEFLKQNFVPVAEQLSHLRGKYKKQVIRKTALKSG